MLSCTRQEWGTDRRVRPSRSYQDRLYQVGLHKGINVGLLVDPWRSGCLGSWTRPCLCLWPKMDKSSRPSHEANTLRMSQSGRVCNRYQRTRSRTEIRRDNCRPIYRSSACCSHTVRSNCYKSGSHVGHLRFFKHYSARWPLLTKRQSSSLLRISSSKKPDE